MPPKAESEKSDRAMTREDLTKFRGALRAISKQLDTLGDLFGYSQADVEDLRKAYFKLGDLLYELDPQERKNKEWVA